MAELSFTDFVSSRKIPITTEVGRAAAMAQYQAYLAKQKTADVDRTAATEQYDKTKQKIVPSVSDKVRAEPDMPVQEQPYAVTPGTLPPKKQDEKLIVQKVAESVLNPAPVTASDRVRDFNQPALRNDKDYEKYLSMNNVADSDSEYETYLKLKEPKAPVASKPLTTVKEMPKEPDIVEEKIAAVGLPATPQPVIEETPADTVIAKVAQEEGWMKDGKIDWDYLGKVAKSTGKSLMELFQSAIAGYTAAQQGRALEQDETLIGRRNIKEEADALALRQEEERARSEGRQDVREEKTAGRQFEMAKKLAELDRADKEIDRVYQDKQAEIERQFQLDRDSKSYDARMQELRAQAEYDKQRIWAASAQQKQIKTQEDPRGLKG